MSNRPEPVINSATVASTVTAVVGILVTIGVLSTEEGTTITNAAAVVIAAVIAVVGVVSHLIAAWHARGKVTPVSEPQDNSGQPLRAL